MPKSWAGWRHGSRMAFYTEGTADINAWGARRGHILFISVDSGVRTSRLGRVVKSLISFLYENSTLLLIQKASPG